MTPWEYMSLRWDPRDSFVSLMEEWGDVGWELIAAVPEENSELLLLLKRPKPDARIGITIKIMTV